MDITGERNAVYRAEILVALEHVRTVSARLAALGVPIADRQDSEALGLARLRLHEERVTDAADLVTRALPAGVPAPPTPPASDLDRLLGGLRALFAAEYAGWVPTLGKNRLVGSVQGGGRISHGGGGDPRVARPPTDTQTAGLPPAREPSALLATVGVLDTGVANDFPLAGGWIGTAADVLRVQPEYRAVAGHGTFVTGLVRSLAPGCVVKVRQVLSPDTGEADAWTVAQEIVALGRTGLDVLNLSMVCYTEDGQPPLVLASAVDRLDPDIVVVAAAGNHGEVGEEHSPERRKPTWPAALDDVVAVGAARSDGTRVGFTPRNAPWIDLHAPGVDVLSTYLTGTVDLNLSDDAPGEDVFAGWARWDGSSFAAALVSGAIAAGTVPGRVPAQQAWRELLRTAKPSEDGEPPFLPLLVR
jgi:membrane-anchored mycosin MYCP